MQSISELNVKSYFCNKQIVTCRIYHLNGTMETFLTGFVDEDLR